MSSSSTPTLGLSRLSIETRGIRRRINQKLRPIVPPLASPVFQTAVSVSLHFCSAQTHPIEHTRRIIFRRVYRR